MKRELPQSGCMCCSPLSRRQFLFSGGLAALGAGMFVLNYTAKPVFGRMADGKKMKIRVFFALHAPVQPGPDWPNVGFDFQPVMKEYMEALEKTMPDVEFVSSMSNGPGETNRILTDDGDKVDGYIVFQMNCWNQVIQSVAASGKPALYCDFLYAGSGGFLVYSAALLRENSQSATFIASSDFDDILEAAKCFNVVAKGGSAKDFVAAVVKLRKERTKPFDKSIKIAEDKIDCLSTKELLAELKTVKILTVEKGWQDYTALSSEDRLGIEVIPVPFAELNDAWKDAMEKKKEESRKIADTWKKEANVVGKDISDKTLFDSAAMYLAQKALLEKYNAMGITVNCLGGFYGGHIHAYPCLGFHKLNNEALIGGCECDVRSAFTMAILTKLTKGRPGYISDPVMDIATRQIIYAHCVAPTKYFGPDGKTNEYEILTHSEDRAGASLRSISPTGYMTTTVEFAPDRKQILFHQAVAVDNSFEDRACRTKICCEVPGDFEKLFTQWDQWSWHRVTIYGDLKKEIFALADAIGWSILEEA